MKLPLENIDRPACWTCHQWDDSSLLQLEPRILLWKREEKGMDSSSTPSPEAVSKTLRVQNLTNKELIPMWVISGYGWMQFWI